MYYFTIRDIENLCDIKAHTLRVWEQRYDFFKPKRKESQHRLYDNEDLKQLLRIAFLYHKGWKVSRIAGLTPEQVLTEVEKIQAAKSSFEYYINQLLECSIDFDKEGFARTLQQVIDSIGFEDTIEKVSYPLLNKIGLLWMTNHVIPAQEHFCSYMIQHKIIAETDRLPLASADAPQVVLFCPHGEYHELPLHYIHYLFRKWGWTTFYLGSNVAIDILKPFAETEKVDHLFLYLITNFTGFTVDDYFEKVCKAFPGKKIVASGRAVFASQRNFVNLTILKTDDAIRQFINNRAATKVL